MATATILSLLLTACGDDSGSTTTATATEAASATTEEGHEVVPDAQVTAGLAATEADMIAVADAQANGTPATEADFERIHETWEAYEGTVKANEVDVYLAIEDALGVFSAAVENGESAPMTKAANDFAAAADSYLAKHP
jgi:hypothetical protein